MGRSSPGAPLFLSLRLFLCLSVCFSLSLPAVCKTPGFTAVIIRDCRIGAGHRRYRDRYKFVPFVRTRSLRTISPSITQFQAAILIPLLLLHACCVSYISICILFKFYSSLRTLHFIPFCFVSSICLLIYLYPYSICIPFCSIFLQHPLFRFSDVPRRVKTYISFLSLRYHLLAWPSSGFIRITIYVDYFLDKRSHNQDKSNFVTWRIDLRLLPRFHIRRDINEGRTISYRSSSVESQVTASDKSSSDRETTHVHSCGDRLRSCCSSFFHCQLSNAKIIQATFRSFLHIIIFYTLFRILSTCYYVLFVCFILSCFCYIIIILYSYVIL